MSGVVPEGAGAVRPGGQPRMLSPRDFEFEGMLGEGAYAKVLLATRKLDGCKYAIKVVDKAHVTKHNKVKTVMQERKALMLLNHCYVVKLHFTFQDQSSLYYVLELARNGELFQDLQSAGKYSVEVARFYAAELVLVLEYMQSEGVVHRDLKPENILFDAAWHIKLVDFGTCLLENDAESNDSRVDFVGTAEYVSPEVLNDGPATHASDLWALGCIIYQMIVGKPPFRGNSEYWTFQLILERKLEFPSDMPANVVDLIQQLLASEPKSRIGSENMQTLKDHSFFHGINWESLPEQVPPRPPAGSASEVDPMSWQLASPGTSANDLAREPRTQAMWDSDEDDVDKLEQAAEVSQDAREPAASSTDAEPESTGGAGKSDEQATGMRRRSKSDEQPARRRRSSDHDNETGCLQGCLGGFRRKWKSRAAKSGIAANSLGMSLLQEGASSDAQWETFLRGGESIVLTGCVHFRRAALLKKRQLILCRDAGAGSRLLLIHIKKMVIVQEIKLRDVDDVLLKGQRMFQLRAKDTIHNFLSPAGDASQWVAHIQRQC